MLHQLHMACTTACTTAVETWGDSRGCLSRPPAALEEQAAHYWDLFYRRNADRFFKDRHYLDREFPCLLTAASILEVGCGVGNALFPLADLNPRATLYGVDFAPTAIDAVRRHRGYGGRVRAHVADVTREALGPFVPLASVQVATLFFVLSAISPQAMPKARWERKGEGRTIGCWDGAMSGWRGPGLTCMHARMHACCPGNLGPEVPEAGRGM